MHSNELRRSLIPKDFESNTISTEKRSLLLFSLSAIFYGFNNFHLKYMQIVHKEDYDLFSFGFWRSICITFWAYILMKKKDIDLIKISQVKNKFWFIMRSFGPFFSVVFFILSLRGLRAGTAGCIVSMNPLAVVVLATLLLKEKFHIKYVVGILICFSGVFLILWNERGGSIENININNNIENIENPSEYQPQIYISLFFGILNLVLFGIMTVASKVLSKENIGHENQCCYIGASNAMCSLICIIINKTFVYNYTFILSCLLNSLFFFIGTLLLVIAVKGIDLSKTTPLNYISVVLSTLLSIFFIGEPIFCTDVVGSLIILGYNIYNSYHTVNG